MIRVSQVIFLCSFFVAVHCEGFNWNKDRIDEINILDSRPLKKFGDSIREKMKANLANFNIDREKMRANLANLHNIEKLKSMGDADSAKLRNTAESKFVDNDATTKVEL